MKHIKNFQSLTNQYDAFFLDLWGVVHDGTAMYPGARECLEQLKCAGKQVVLISNAPRRAAKAQEVLDQLGVRRDLYQAIFTSGEVGYHHMQSGWFDVGEYYLFIGPERDSEVLSGLPKHRVHAVEKADFLLNVGFGSEQEDTADINELLSKAKDLELPMLCLNPDLHVVKITGERYECAGVIAQHYKNIGGAVHYFGKPYPAIYDMAHESIKHMNKKHILAVGDGLDTDIRGAVAYGIDSLLITGGILQNHLDIEFQSENTPSFLMSSWSW